MQKEIVTKENILYEAKARFKDTAKVAIGCLIVSALLFIFILWIFIVVLQKIFPIVGLFLLMLPMSLMIVFLWMLLEGYKEYRVLKNGCFRITTDTLVNYEDKQVDFLSASTHPRPYILWFKTYGKYIVPDERHYRTSNIFEMNDDGIFNTAVIGDTFFLILNAKEKILKVYNTKFFELKE